MIFAEEMGPVAWTAVASAIATAAVSVYLSIKKERRTDKKEDADAKKAERDEINKQYQEMYERAKRQCEEDKDELKAEINELRQKVGRLERMALWLRQVYTQERVRRQYVESVAASHNVDLKAWDMSTAELPAFDSEPPKTPTDFADERERKS